VKYCADGGLLVGGLYTSSIVEKGRYPHQHPLRSTYPYLECD
jgi:hypothetical protein